MLSNACEYLTSPGTDSGMVDIGHPWPALMRVNTPEYQRSKKDVHERVAANFRVLFGDQLFKYVHIGKEPCVMNLLMGKLIHMTPVDLRPLLDGVPIYDTAKHIQRLGLSSRLPALASTDRCEPDKFLKPFEYVSVARSVVAEGLGVNMWALLLLASLLGTEDIHINNTRSQVSMEILSLILALGPSGITQGGLCPLRSIHNRTLQAQSMLVPTTGRIESFLRPLHDPEFANKGVFASCPMVDGWMPEDTLHMGALMAFARRILHGRDWSEVPPEKLLVDYQVVPNRHYPIFRKGSEGEPSVTGSVRVDGRRCEIRYGEETEDLNLEDWSRELGRKGFLMAPVVFRSGALVTVRHETYRVGCLVPNGTAESMLAAGMETGQRGPYVGNFDFIRMGYHALVGPDGETVFMDMESTWENLIAPGTLIYLAPDTPTWLGLKDEGLFPRRSSDDPDYNICALRCRLNVPTEMNPIPGKVYVTVMERKRGGVDKNNSRYRTLQVDPWELATESDGFCVIPHLVVGAASA